MSEETTTAPEVYKATAQDKRVVELNKDIQLPKDRYTIRVKDVEYGPSSKGNFMFTWTPELVWPDTFVAGNGTIVSIAGKDLKKQYIALKIKNPETGQWDMEATQKAVDRYFDQLDKWGVDTTEMRESGIDLNNPPKVIKGLVLDAICGSDEYVRRKDPTPEQKAQNKQGDIIKGADGKEIKSYTAVVYEILGPGDSSVAANKPF